MQGQTRQGLKEVLREKDRWNRRGLDKNDSPLVVWQLEPLEDSENPLLKGHVAEGEEEKEEQFEVRMWVVDLKMEWGVGKGEAGERT